MLEKELALEIELRGNNNDTFLYRLHEDSIWDEQAYDVFACSCFALLEQYRQHGKTEHTAELLQLLVDRLAYITSLIFCHYSGVDQYTIKNWNDEMERIKIPAYLADYRKIISMVFLA